MRKHLLFAPFLLGLLCAPISAACAAACAVGGRALADFDDSALLEAHAAVTCTASRPEIAAALHERLARGQLDGFDGIAADRMRLTLEFDMLRGALRDRDRTRIERTLALLDAGVVANARPDEPEAFDVMLRENASIRLATIRSILDGSTQPPAPVASDPLPDWTLHFGFCGMPVVSFLHEALEFPGSEDAWSAVGRDDLAIDHLLRTQWIQAVNLGTVPPRLAEFGQRMLGERGYAREIEAALAGIRIDATATGRVAAIPLLGHWLPLPVGMRPVDDDIVTRFDSPEQLANWLRPMLMPR